MKKTVLVIIAAMFAFIGTTSAQQKIGHINSLDVLQAMPEFKQMTTDIEKQKQSYSKALEGMYGDYDKKQKDLKELSDKKDTPDPILESKIQEIERDIEEIKEIEIKSSKKANIKQKYLKYKQKYLNLKKNQ